MVVDVDSVNYCIEYDIMGEVWVLVKVLWCV